ncbi:MAG: hypothetical protein N2Z81_05720 [Hydrogenothermaceae bacterium]|nr:hypothetical protein [Hydrogenothermaceae bacterium]
MLRKVVAGILALFSISFADSLTVNKSGFSTYTQINEFILPEGESVVGPIKLLPLAKVESLVITPTDSTVSVVGYVFEPSRSNWIENIVGKTISIEGEGRVISGTVISVKDGYITIDTKRGLIITTLPTFPSRLSSSLNWQDLMSPKITVRLKSLKPQNASVKISYPLEGFSWQVSYVGNVMKDKVLIQEFYTIKNETSLNLKDVELYIKDRDMTVKLFNKTFIEPYTSKVVKYREMEGSLSGKVIKIPEKYNLNNTTINLYKDNIFLGTFKVINNTVNLP